MPDRCDTALKLNKSCSLRFRFKCQVNIPLITIHTRCCQPYPPYMYFRLCSEYEECPGSQTPSRLQDIYMYYEDHCKRNNTLLQSKDYVAKIIPRLFKDCQRTRVCLNRTAYMAFQGIRRSADKDCWFDDPVIVLRRGINEVLFALPTVYTKNKDPVNVVTSITNDISVTVSTASDAQAVDLATIDVSPKSFVSRPEKAMVQISKSLRLCRGVEDKNESTSSDTWTSILDRQEERRLRSPACQTVVSWLSSSEVCGSCRAFSKKHEKQAKKHHPVESFSLPTEEENLLQTVVQKVSKGGTADSLEVLLRSQLKNMDTIKDPRHRRWSPAIITLCLTLYCRSPQAYADLKANDMLVLPSKRLLQYYKNSVDQAPGINAQQLEWMVKEASTKNVTGFGKRGGLVLDEMTIQDDLQIVRKGDTWTVIGLVDNGQTANNVETIIQNKTETKMATHVLQFVFQGFTGFRWPVAYFATDSATAHQLYLNVWEVVQEVEERGFMIDYIMMDGGSANRAFTSMLFMEDPRKEGFSTPNVFDFSRSISIVQDIKHCFKKIRNGIESSRQANRSTKGRFLVCNGHAIIWEHFEAAYEFNTQSGLRLHKHLTREHIILTPANKMRNNLATQVLDHDMLYLMKAYQATQENPESLSSTIDLLKHTSVLVDFFMDVNRPVRSGDPRLKDIERCLNFFNEWESSTNDAKHLLTKECRDDLNSAVTGFLAMCGRVLADGDHIKPGYFNSDIVENFFCQQRGIKHGCNTNPTVLQYGPAVNAICLGQTTVSRKNNSSTSASFFKAETLGGVSRK